MEYASLNGFSRAAKPRGYFSSIKWRSNSVSLSNAPQTTQSSGVRAMQVPGLPHRNSMTVSDEGMRLIRQFEAALGETGISLRLPQTEAMVNNSVTVQLSQSQYDALVSFCFSLEEGQFRDSSLILMLNQGNYKVVPDEIRKWIKINNVEDGNLVRRRAAEAELFSRGSYVGAQSVYQSYLVFAKSIPGLSRAQNPAVVIAAAGLGWQIFKGIMDNSGDNSWNLSKMEGVKCPSDDTARYRNKDVFREFRFTVNRGIESPLSSSISQSAAFEVRFSGNGYAIGPVTVQQIRNSDIPTWSLFVDNIMVVNPNNFSRSDGEIMSAVDITFNYRFSNTFVNDAIWIGEYRIFADGRMSVISERWTNTPPLGT